MNRSMLILATAASLVPGQATAQQAPEVTISQVRELNDDGTGSALENQVIRLTGVTTTDGRRFAPTSRNCDAPPCDPGVGFYVDDGQAAVFVWSYLPSAGIDTLVRGQRVEVTGLVRTFQGRTMLTDYNDPACEREDAPPRCHEGSIPRIAPSHQVIDAEAEMPAPLTMDLRTFQESGESLEGRLVAVTSVFSDDLSQRFPRAGTDGSFQLHDPSVPPGEPPVPLYVERTTDVAGQVWRERSQADLVAIADQFYNSGGAAGNRGRRLRARSWDDFSNFAPRQDDQMPQERLAIADLRGEDGISPHEGRRVWVEGWLTTEYTTFRDSRTSGIGFAIQDDTGGVVVKSNAVDHAWAVVEEGAAQCSSDTDCSEGQACGPFSVCQGVLGLEQLRSGVRVRVVGKVSTVRGRMVLTDPRLEDTILVELTGASDDEPAERSFAPVELTAQELLTGGEEYEGRLVVIRGLHLADANQQLPLPGRSGSFRLGDGANIAVDVNVEKFACEEDDGAQVCVNRSAMSLPPETYSGESAWNKFQFDLIGVADERTEGGGAGRRGIAPRFPSDFENFRDFRVDEEVDAGPTVTPGGGTPPDSGCGCTGAGADLLWLVAVPAVLRRRRKAACANGPQ